jgi:uncharacterized protein GlcG (DUF336 family)
MTRTCWRAAAWCVAFVLVGCLLAGTTAWAQLADKKALTLAVAKQIAAAAAAEAETNKWNVVIAIVDDGGYLVYLERRDETQIGSIEVAIQKAKTAVSFKRPTKALDDALTGGRMAILTLPGALPLEGGVPITLDGKVLGAVGVSGVTAQQDGQIATAGVKALPKILGK